MNQHFDTLEVARSLGVAPSTAAIIAGLLNGQVNPDNCRSVEHWAIADLGAPPQYKKVLAAIASLLGLKKSSIKQLNTSTVEDGLYLKYIEGQPTVIWTGVKFLLGTVHVK